MSYGTNLAAILGILKLNNKSASEKIGISPNTLSNILNEKFEPSEDSKEKILLFIISRGFSEEDLLKEDKIFQNIRIRCSKMLSGLEKAQFRDDFHNFMKNQLEKSDSKPEEWLNYFEIFDRPTENTNQETFYDRRKLLIKSLEKSNSKYLFSIVDNFYKEIFKDNIFIDSQSPIEITYLLDSLGIRRFFFHFTTEKISSFSTSLNHKYTTPFSYFEEYPVIVINTKVCNTTEKQLFEMAKQFYFMAALQDEYNFLSVNKISVENSENEKNAIDFAEKVMIKTESLNQYLEKNKKYFPQIFSQDRSNRNFFFKNYDFAFVVNEIKRNFHVGYKLAIKKLLESNFEYSSFFENTEEAKKFYFICLKKTEETSKMKTAELNGEPEPLPSAFRGHDFSIRQKPE